MMRVLQVVNRLARGGGAEKVVLDLGVALNKIDGVSVEILSLGSPHNLDYVDAATRAGIAHHCLSKGKPSWRNLLKLSRFMKKGEYDVVHVHLFPSLYMVALASLFGCGRIKFVYTEHSTSNRRRGKRIFQIIDHWIYSQYDNIVGISEEVSGNLKRHAGLSHVELIGNGIDNCQIQATESASYLRDELKLTADSIIVTMVGRFVPGKDYSTLIQSLGKLPESIHVVCVGDGPLKESVRSQTQKKSYAGRVHFLGLRSDVISIVKESDIVVLSTEHEGFSISMLEAMACGKPFVASAVPGIKDLVENSALLFTYQNVDELADCIIRLTENRSLYDEMSAKSRAFAQQYDMSTIAGKYLNVYGKK